MLKFLIIDDEIAAGNILNLLLEKLVTLPKEIRICTDPADGLLLLETFSPDLVFLDIEMPNMNGFDFLNKVSHLNFNVIFTTAYDNYAIKAIRFSALDYLLKPIDIMDLQNAINRFLNTLTNDAFKRQQAVGNLINNLQQKSIENFKLSISTTQGVFFYATSEIIYCEGVSNYTRFHLVNKPPMLVSKTLKEYEELLADHQFLRVHKSFLVNLSYVVKFAKDGCLWLNNGKSIAVSRRKKEEIKKWIKH